MCDSEQIINRFSTRIYLKDRQGVAGLIPVQESNRTLRSLMEHLVESEPNLGEDDWARYFLKVLIIESPKNYHFLSWINAELSVIHQHFVTLILYNEFLFTYLQPVCWRAAQKIAYQFNNSPSIYLHYPQEECFIIASEVASKPGKLLKTFSFSSNFSLQSYALNALKRIIKNQVAKELKSKSVKLSDCGLLRTLDKKGIEKALTEYGIQGKYFHCYCLVWQSFKDLFEENYPPTSSNGSRSKNLPTTSLNDQQVSQIATRYNQQLRRLGIQNKPATGQEIKEMLARCIQVVRTSQNAQVISLEAQSEGSDIESNFWQDFNPMEAVIEEEKREELAQIRNIVLQEFEALDALAKKSLRLWLGLGINQNDFLSLFNLDKQYQVSRQFKTYLITLLKTVMTSFDVQDELGKTLTEREVNQIVNNQFDAIKEYLTFYSKEYFTFILDKISNQELSYEEKIVLSRYLKNLADQFKAKRRAKPIPVTDLEVPVQVLEIKQKVQQNFKNCVEDQLQIQLNKFSSAEKSITNFIDEWLQQNQATLC